MKKKLIILALLFCVGFIIEAKDIEITLEAELAQIIEEPMKIDDSSKGKGVSNGKFIWMEGKPAVGGRGKGWAEFDIPIQKRASMPFGDVS